MINPISVSYEEFISSLNVHKKLETFYSVVLPQHLAELFAIIEKNETTVSSVYMNANRFADFRKYGRDLIDSVKDKEIVSRGIFAVMWGAEINVSITIPDNVIVVVGKNKMAAILELGKEMSYGKELIEIEECLKEYSAKLYSLQRQVSHLIGDMLLKK